MPTAAPDVGIDLSLLLDAPYDVVLHNDPVNSFEYVIGALIAVFGYPKGRAQILTQDAHDHGEAVVWSGGEAEAEAYVAALRSYGLVATCRKER
jgi:ATP-dependent Clp protease adaptor protein ClpS